MQPPLRWTPARRDAVKRVGGAAHGGRACPEFMATGALQGDSVINRQGEHMGTIRDIVVDVLGGRIAYVVLSSGGLWGFGDRQCAVPWSALTVDLDKHRFVMDVDAAESCWA